MHPIYNCNRNGEKRTLCRDTDHLKLISVMFKVGMCVCACVCSLGKEVVVGLMKEREEYKTLTFVSMVVT